MRRRSDAACLMRRRRAGAGLALLLTLLQTAALAQGPVDRKAPGDSPLPGMPPLLDPHDVYAGARPGLLSAAVRGHVPRVYVPNSGRGTVDVIDPATYKIVDHFKVGREPQHVTPSYDLKSLWVLADEGDSLTRIDPVTGHREQTVRVPIRTTVLHARRPVRDCGGRAEAASGLPRCAHHGAR